MSFFKKTFFILSIFMFTCNLSFAQTIKYTLGPTCKENKVICSGLNEVAVCLTINPKIKIETISFENHIQNKYEPTCNVFPDISLPGCIDKDSGLLAKNAVIECVEFIKCEKDNLNNTTANCSQGKIPKCLGSDDLPDCNNKVLCANNAIPICDYTWQAKN